MATATIAASCLLSFLTSAVLLRAQSTITTVAGNGTAGFSGDGGPAASASFNQPVYVVVDGEGNLIIADSLNHRVRRVNPSGVVTTIAGTGAPGFSGDGGAASQAALNSPLGLCLDEPGNLYIADVGNNRIRRLTPAGSISTVAGNGARAAGIDGVSALSTPLFIGIRCAVDRGGNLYIADQGSHRIRKVSPNGVISTAAGTGSRGFSGDGGAATAAALDNPTAVAVDAAGNILFSDQSNHRIRRVSTAGVIGTIAGNGSPGFSGDGGSATSASLNFPGGLIADANGDVYFADDENFRIRKVSASGTITTVAGNGQRGFSGDGGDALSASMNGQFGVALDAAGNLYFADTLNHRVRRVSGVSTSAPAPSFSAAGVNVLGLLVSGLTPGAMATVTGRNLSLNINGVVTADLLPLPLQLAGASITVEGQPSPVVTVTNTSGQEQIQFQAPFEIAGKETVQVIVNNGRAASAPVAVPVLASRPSIVMLDGIFASIVREGGSAVTPLNPVAAGEKISLFCRALGAVDPPLPTGAQSLADPVSSTAVLPEITMDGRAATVTASILAPGFVGLYQIDVTVPEGVTAGLVNLIVTSNGVSSAAAKIPTR